jgi:DNA-binding transcriptional ArsR family regulator
MSEDRLSQVFAALADPTRRDIVARLAVGDATVSQLAAPYNVSIQAVSKHLKGTRGRRSGQPQPRCPAPTPTPRGGGIRHDDRLDRALPQAS